MFQSCGNFSTSTNPAAGGFGFCMATPRNFIANNAGCLVFNSPAGASTVTTLAPADSVTRFSNSPYTIAQIGSGTGLIQYRLVAFGIMIEATTPVLNLGGTFLGIHEEHHDPLVLQSFTALDAYAEKKVTTIASMATKPINFTYAISDTDDVDYQNATLGLGAPDTCYMVAAVQAADTSGVVVQSFRYEAYAHFELYGSNISGRQHPNIDVVGFNGVTQVMKQFATLYQPSQVPPQKKQEAVGPMIAKYIDAATTKIISSPLGLLPPLSQRPVTKPPPRKTDWTEKGLQFAEKAGNYSVQALDVLLPILLAELAL
jgi:hypothetical protein